ncbi:unnamed protein product [Durusdinium trenchii]|uniref:60S ribosomal protein L22 1 n=2 Tax=Durusdinium trenchii TaxID=1381693 RepID=A0ABP0QTS5_9DINO
MAHPSYDISEIMGRVADKVAAMEPTSPEVIRAVTACHALRCGRGISRHEYRKSFPTTQIKQFWSHSWQGGWRSKITTLLFLHNHIPAVICSSLGALVVASLFAAKLLPGPEWDKELWIYPRGFWAMLVGPVIYLLVLLLWQPQQSVFLDIMCIDQEDPRQKASGMLSMGAFLKCSNSLLVLWDPSYTRRLWCIFELAAFLHTRPTGKKFKLLVRPLILGPCSVLLTLTMVVVVIAIGWVPQRDGLAGSEALWGGQVLVLFIGLWAMISVSRRYFRAVEQLRNELSHFSLEETECFCCQRNHVDRSGNPIQICDRMVLLQCIRTWFGTLEVFEQMVRREVLKCLLEELSSQFFTYRHCITATIPLLWSHLDMAGAMLHYLDQWPGRTWRSALDVAILRGAGWWLGVVPTLLVFSMRLSCAFRKKREGPFCDTLVTFGILLCTVAAFAGFVQFERYIMFLVGIFKDSLEIVVPHLSECVFLLSVLLAAAVAFFCIGIHPRSFTEVALPPQIGEPDSPNEPPAVLGRNQLSL